MATTVRVYRRLLAESAGIAPPELPRLGAAVGEALDARWPDLVEEVEGIAAGAGQSAEELLAINARTELLGGAGEGECSLAGEVGDESVTLAQNWDWHPALAGARVVWTVHQSRGAWFTTVTEAGILAKLGVSSRRLACGLNFLTSSLDGGRRGVPIHVLLRVLLDRCETVSGALGLLLESDVAASSCITLAAVEDDGAALVSVELSPGGAGLVWPDATGRLVHTNHFLAPLRCGFDTQAREHPATLLRAWRLRRALDAGVRIDAALRAHFPAGAPVCRHADEAAPWAEGRATLLSVVIDPGAPRLLLADGPPCTRAYVDVPLPAERARAA